MMSSQRPSNRDAAGFGHAEDELITTLVEHLGPAGLVDLTLVVGKYIAMGRFMQVLGLDQSCELDPERVARIHG